MAALPPGLSGPVTLRVLDTMREESGLDFDTIYTLAQGDHPAAQRVARRFGEEAVGISLDEILTNNNLSRDDFVSAGELLIVGYGAIAWVPAFLIRSFGMSTGEIGTALALIVALPGGQTSPPRSVSAGTKGT